MALFHSHFFSEVLGMQSEAMVIIPQPASEQQIGLQTASARDTWPCLWLLHGLSDDHTAWLRRTSIERYAEAAGCAVVMPNCHRSFYRDMAQGGEYGTFLMEELPALMRSFFPLSPERKDNAVAGLSMGGGGAVRWLLNRPEHFIAGASLSGVLDPAGRVEEVRRNEPGRMLAESLALAYGDQDLRGSSEDLCWRVGQLPPESLRPPLLQICGTEDFLYDDNLRFRDAALQAGYPLTYRERPGSHEWGFWDQSIQEVLTWLPEQGFGS
ncbi:MAG: alpha/beta hydrolase [Kiritimatiellia bacterium]